LSFGVPFLCFLTFFFVIDFLSLCLPTPVNRLYGSLYSYLKEFSMSSHPLSLRYQVATLFPFGEDGFQSGSRSTAIKDKFFFPRCPLISFPRIPTFSHFEIARLLKELCSPPHVFRYHPLICQSSQSAQIPWYTCDQFPPGSFCISHDSRQRFAPSDLARPVRLFFCPLSVHS